VSGGSTSPNSVSAAIVRFLVARGIDRIFGLCGGHIMPIWIDADRAGIRIIDVRDERAAVHMAQAHAEITGELGVALVTAGPGVTNAITGIANAHVSRAPVLVISGTPPRPQEFRGALQGIDHVPMVESITRYARTVRERGLVLSELDTACAKALGHGGAPGPAYIDFPTDVLREAMPKALAREELMRPKTKPLLAPATQDVEMAAKLIWAAKRPLVIAGRGARGARAELSDLLDRTGALYLDTTEARGLVSDDHPGLVNAMRGQVMREADLVLTVGRKLDFQLAYGSPAVFENAAFVRIADNFDELADNRRGDAEIMADPARALAAILDQAGNAKPKTDRAWTKTTRERHEQRVAKMSAGLAESPPDADGRMHPYVLLGALKESLDDDAILVADGGDILSFARVALSPRTYLDPGALGCLGVGVPFGIAAALARPGGQVAVVTGDGSFGFNAIDIETAKRHKAGVVFIVANNAAWNIEVHDQKVTHDHNVGTKLTDCDYAQMAQALGLHAERVDNASKLPDALERAFANTPALLDVAVSVEAVSSDAKAGLAWVPDLQPLAAWDEAERAWREGKGKS